MKKLIGLLFMFIFVLASCGDSKDAQVDGKQENEERVLPIGYTEIHGADTYSITDNLPVWQKVQENLDIKVEWMITAQNQYDTVMQTRLASGQDLPDIIKIPGTLTEGLKYATQGLIIPISDYIDEYGPNIKKLFEKYPEIEKGITTPDGKIYFTTNYMTGLNGQGIAVRKDWLDALDMEIPMTIEEFYEYFIACKTTDLNGQGVGTIVPFGGIGKDALSQFLSGFGLMVQNGQNYYYAYDGKMEFNAMKDEFKEFLTFTNKLYSEGLLDPMYGAGQSQINELTNRNCVASKPEYPGGADNVTDQVRNYGVPDAEAIFALSPLDKDGNLNYAPLPFARNTVFIAITKDCDNIPLAMELLDYTWASAEGVDLMTMGIEGTHWNQEADEAVFVDDMINHEQYSILLRLWQEGAFFFLDCQTEKVNNARAKDQFKVGLELFAENADMLSAPLPALLPTEEEQKIVVARYTDITS